MHDREYGARAVIGVAIPQANPTVEPEMAALMPPGVSLVATRLTSQCSEPRERLFQYESGFHHAPASFDTLKLDALGFACTGASYLVGAAVEDERIAELSNSVGYPVMSAAQAIKAALSRLKARRMALLSPYAAWLTDAGLDYWREQGIEIVQTATIALPSSDTRGVYAIRNASVMQVSEAFMGVSADVLLLSGTGMPTLRALEPLQQKLGIPVLSSNYCLAWALLDRLELLSPRADGGSLLSGYESALERL
ncbi:maleate cis-trans isomerase family protein [Allopusillimonas ginsengisoli]|uniref:maleate cis-trans isomerase family protein n=1 Tax=Allopusillimonas ginsengisoli TaxID=453575 RepID=UPI001021C7F4|nr:aspartate/glutamate racemase family protein [Allopusillimonas ginsengisoli]TEA76864.1 hypothetical protein ERE07_17620 [Allopusillimonas ginsengisoli]